MKTTLGKSETCPKNLPFAMHFAVKPNFVGMSSEELRQALRYNPQKQLNDESLISPVAGQTSTSVRTSTNTFPGYADSDEDTKNDESQ